MTAIRKSGGHGRQRLLDVGRDHPAEQRRLDVAPVAADAAQELLEVRRRRLRLGQDHVLALALAVAVAEDVGQDAEQPGLAVGAGLEGVEEAVGAQQRVLDQVLGVLLVAGHPQRGRVQGAQMRERLAFEVSRRGRRFIIVFAPRLSEPPAPLEFIPGLSNIPR